MYGLIHRSIMGMVMAQHGEDAWQRVKTAAGARDEDFLTMQVYDDEVSLALVRAASEELQLAPEKCLEAFGRFWITDTAKKAYSTLLMSYGTRMWDLLENLDYMHDRISTSFPGFNAPSFQLEPVDDAHYLLHYTSSRCGLEAFVVGLIKGLVEEFNTPVKISIRSNVVDARGQRTTFFLESISA